MNLLLATYYIDNSKKKKKEEVNFIIYGSVIVPKVWDARERMRTVQSRHLLSVEHVQIQRHIA